MRILIVGAGALGGLAGGYLTRAGEDVVLIERNPVRARLLASEGITISRVGADAAMVVPLAVVVSAEGLAPADLVFVAVKAHQTGEAVRAVLPATGPRTLFLSIQNGIGNAEAIGELVGPARVLCGITYHSVQHNGPGRLRFRPGIKPIQVAPLDGVLTPAKLAVAEVFRRAGLEIDIVANIDHAVWQKLLHNAVINPVAALTGLTCRELLGDDDLLAFMRDLCAEIVAVMRARAIPIVNPADPFQPLVESLAALGNNRPSMWQDLARGLRTEVDALNGAVAAEAARHGLAAPYNTALVRFVHSRERHAFLDRQDLVRRLGLAVGGPEQPAPTVRTAAGRVAPPRPRPTTNPALLESTARLRQLVAAYYRDLDVASRDPGRRVAACSALAPVELVRALGIVPYFPEHHAALISARHRSAQCIAAAAPLGLSQFSNSAMRCDLGAMLGDISPLADEYGIAGPPRPDVAVCATNAGRDLLPWFEYYSSTFDIPVLSVHPPPAMRRSDDDELHGLTERMIRLADELEPIAGRRLDPDRLSETVEHTEDAARLWTAILDLARAVPSPLTVFDTMTHVAPMSLLRGTPEAVQYYRLLKGELEERLARGIAAVPDESLRFYWDGPPIWHGIAALAALFAELRIAVIGSTFAEAFTFGGLDARDPFAGLARACATVFPNRSDEAKSLYLAEKFVQLSVDAAAYHDCRTSPEASHVRYGMPARAERLTAVPRFIIEADSHDERLLDLDRLRRQLIEFVEARAATAAAPDGGTDA